MDSKSLWAVTLIILFWSPLWAFSQVSSASLQGTVTDQSEASIPGVEVTVTNVDTGSDRTVITDDAGRYRAPQLAIGNYEVKAELIGFRTAVRSGINLTVGQQAVVDITLEIGEISEVVEVTGLASLVNTTSSEISGLVDSKTMRDLPLNGRNYVSLALLQTGVTFSGRLAPSGGSTIAGPGLRFQVNGTRFDQNAFVLDGQDIQDTFNATPSTGGGESLGVDTLQEFEVKTSNYSAEYSKAAGAVINAVTKSGTNEIHGSAFWFHRNDNLDASNFFDNSFSVKKPEFKRHQFGATIGGPIVQNQTFWFFGYEGLREGLGLARRFTVPTDDAKRGLVDGVQIPISPLIQPYVDNLFPFSVNGDTFSGGRGEFFVSRTDVKRDDFVVGKVDHQFSDTHSANFRYNLVDGVFTVPGGTIVASALPTINQYLSASLQSIISPTLLNSFTFGFNRSRLTDADDFQLTDLPESLNYTGYDSTGQLSTSGFSSLGKGTLRPRDFLLRLYDVRDTVNITRGNHQFKLGGTFQLFQTDTNNSLWNKGSYSFSNWPNFLQAIPRTFLGADPDLDFFRNFRQKLFGLFLQDDFKLSPHLTLNLGLRYEIITAPTETDGKLANLRSILAETITEGEPYYENPRKNIAPRIGFAWDLFGDGKTSLRGGGGMFHAQILANQYRFMASGNPPFSGTLFQRNPPFPNASETAGGRSVTAHSFPFEVEQATNYQWNLTIQRELLPSTVLSVGYVGSRGVHLGRSMSGQDANLAFPIICDGRKFFAENCGDDPESVTLDKRNTNFGTIRTIFYDANSFYHGLQLGLRRRVAQGLSFQGSYTYSKAIDEASGVWGGTASGFSSPQDMHDRLAERAAAGFDVRHNFILNSTYDLPGRGTGDAFVGKLLSGWQLSGILNLSTSVPFSVRVDGGDDPDGDRSTSDLRPDLVAGANNNPIIGDPQGWFDPSSFALPQPGFYGNLGRNTLRADGLANLDLALKKNTSLGEVGELQFRVEAFNILNHTNFRTPSVIEIFIDNSKTPLQDSGKVLSTSTTSRQIQLALKILW